MNGEVVQLPVDAVGPRHAALLIPGSAAPSHDMRADDLGEQRLHRQICNLLFRLRPRFIWPCELMNRQHLPRAGSELDLGHGQHGPARPLHDEAGQRVIEHCGAVAAKLHLPARRLRMKSVAHQRKEHMRVWEFPE